MAFNAFPASYQGFYPQAYNLPVNNQNSAQSQNTGIIWVQGEAGAKSYLVAPNTTVQLWDSEAQVIYLKSSDASGMPSMKIIDYSIRNQPDTSAKAAEGKYITVDDLNAVKREIDALRGEIDDLRKGETDE